MTEKDLKIDTLVVVIVAALFATIAAEFAGLHVPIVRPVTAFLVLTFAPGALLLPLLGVEPEVRLRWVLYCCGVSLIGLLGVGTMFNLIALALGVDRPLTVVNLCLLIGGVILGLLAANWYRGRDHLSIRVDYAEPLVSPGLLVLALFPPVTVLSVFVLNAREVTIPLVTVLFALSVLPLAAVFVDSFERWHAIGLFVMSLSLLYHSVLSWSSFHGGHGYIIRAVRMGRWLPSEYSLLPNAILYPIYSLISGLGPLTEASVLNPILVSFIPLCLYATFRRYTGARAAFLGATLFVFSHPFYTLYPRGGRVATPVLFLTLIGVTLSDERLPSRTRRLLSLLFGTGVVVSHYGTSYVVMFALTMTAVLLVGHQLVDSVVHALGPDESGPITIRGALTRLERVLERDRSVLTGSYVGFYAVACIGWYMFAANGRKFEPLPQHVMTTVRDLLYSTGGGGGTANRLQANYGAVSIRYAKYVYLAVALLIAVGLVVVYYRRFHPRRSIPFDDEYIAFSSTLLAIFSLSLLFSGSWGGGRPMMIVFSFTAIFAVVGSRALVGGARLAGSRVWRRVTGARRLHGRHSDAVFAVLLTVLLVLNAGPAAFVVFGGSAPSNVVLQDQIEETDNPQMVVLLFIETDIETHVWFGTHRNRSYPIYGDQATRGQANDWYNAHMQARNVTDPHVLKRKNSLQSLKGGDVEQGYVLLMGHNLATNESAVGRAGSESIRGLYGEFTARNRVYDSGYSLVLFAASPSDTGNASVTEAFGSEIG